MPTPTCLGVKGKEEVQSTLQFNRMSFLQIWKPKHKSITLVRLDKLRCLWFQNRFLNKKDSSRALDGRIEQSYATGSTTWFFLFLKTGGRVENAWQRELTLLFFKSKLSYLRQAEILICMLQFYDKCSISLTSVWNTVNLSQISYLNGIFCDCEERKGEVSRILKLSTLYCMSCSHIWAGLFNLPLLFCVGSMLFTVVEIVPSVIRRTNR